MQSVTLGDDEARARGSQKSILERAQPPTFPIVLELRDRSLWVTHWVEDSVDALLRNTTPMVTVRRRHPVDHSVTTQSCPYEAGDIPLTAEDARASAHGGLSADAVTLDGPGALGGQYTDVYAGSTFVAGSDAFDVDDSYAWAQRLADLTDDDALTAISRGGLRAAFGAKPRGSNRSRSAGVRNTPKARSRS